MDSLFGCNNYTECYLLGERVEWYYYYLIAFGCCFIISIVLLSILSLVFYIDRSFKGGKV